METLRDLHLPKKSPPLFGGGSDLFIQSAFSTQSLSKRFGVQTHSKPAARLEAVIHTTPEKLQGYLRDFSSSRREWTESVDAVVEGEVKGKGGEKLIAYSIHSGKVRHAHVNG